MCHLCRSKSAKTNLYYFELIFQIYWTHLLKWNIWGIQYKIFWLLICVGADFPGLNYSHPVFAQGAQDMTSKADLIRSWNIFLFISSPLSPHPGEVQTFSFSPESEDDRKAVCDETVLGSQVTFGSTVPGGLSGRWAKLIPPSLPGLIIPTPGKVHWLPNCEN